MMIGRRKYYLGNQQSLIVCPPEGRACTSHVLHMTPSLLFSHYAMQALFHPSPNDPYNLPWDGSLIICIKDSSSNMYATILSY